MSNDENLKARPVVDALTEPYWKAAAEHRLIVQQCTRCDRYQFYPRPFCIHCGADEVAWREASGKGTLHTFSVVHRSALPGFELPYVFAIVELEEGVRVTCNLPGVPIEDVKIGMPLQVTFEDLGEGAALPQFTSVA